MTSARFRKIIWQHYRDYKRAMPWRETRDPYRILVSEIMLQQTQVDRVVGFYENFIKKFPNFATLARAKTADVLRAWQGLGYNRRALSLQKLAQTVVAEHRGKLPMDRAALEELPGIGPGTSGSLTAFVFNQPIVFIETNVRRVFIHFFFPSRENVLDAELEPFVRKTLDAKNSREWYWALMDYGAMLGGQTRARALKNPNLRSAHYVRQSKFAGSDRELRGKMLRLLLARKKISVASLADHFPASKARISSVSRALIREGFAVERGNYLSLA